MDEKDLEEKLKKLRLEEPDKSVMESHKKAFGKQVLQYAYEANERESKRRKTRLALAHSLAVLVFIVSLFFVRFQMQKRMFYNIAFNNPSVTIIYKRMFTQRLFRPKIIKVTENKKLGIARLYPNMRIFVITDLKDKKVIGVGIPLSENDKSKYLKKTIYISDADKDKVLKIISNNSFIAQLKKKSVIVKDRASVFVYKSDSSLSPKIAEVEITTESGDTVTAFVDISNNRILDITDMKNTIGELITRNPDIHYFLCIDENY